MSSEISWWLWIGFVLIFLFNVFRKLKGGADPTDKIAGKNAPQAEREDRLANMLDALRQAAEGKARTPPRQSKRLAHSPALPPAAPLSIPTAEGKTGIAIPAETSRVLEESLSFSDHPLVQGIAISEILSPPVALRPPERLV